MCGIEDVRERYFFLSSFNDPAKALAIAEIAKRMNDQRRECFGSDEHFYDPATLSSVFLVKATGCWTIAVPDGSLKILDMGLRERDFIRRAYPECLRSV